MWQRWLTAGVVLLANVCAASAQSWPSKPVRIIVPVSAGSATDVTARIIADHLTTQLGQPFIVENRTGAGGTTGMGYVAKQVEPDGYTILVHSAAFTIQPSTFPNLGYDSGKDFAGVTLLGMAPLVMIASAGEVQDAEGSGDRRQGQAGLDQLLDGRLWRGGASRRGAAPPRRGLPGPANSVPRRARGDQRGAVRTLRLLLLADAAGHPAHQGRQAGGTGDVELEARAVAAGRADHGRSRLSELGVQFLARHVGAGEDAAAHRREALPRKHGRR